MRRLLVSAGVVLFPTLTFAQAQPPQLTNDDLLRLIGLQQVQNLQCGKALEAAQQALKTQQEKQNAPAPSPK